MKTLQTRESYQLFDMDDVTRIISACAAAGYIISQITAAEIWMTHCDLCGSSWLPLPNDDRELIGIILSYSSEVTE